MDNEVEGITRAGLPVVLATAAMAGVLAFLASMTATFLGGLARLPRTLPDDILTVLYVTPLVILVPWITFLLTRRWQRVHTNDATQKWTRLWKCVTLMIVGVGTAMIIRCLLLLEVVRRFGLRLDHELPAAGVLFLAGACCCFEHLRDYKMTSRWKWTPPTSQQRFLYLCISATVIAVTVGFVGYLVAIGKIR